MRIDTAVLGVIRDNIAYDSGGALRCVACHALHARHPSVGAWDTPMACCRHLSPGGPRTEAKVAAGATTLVRILGNRATFAADGLPSNQPVDEIEDRIYEDVPDGR
jgi:hypothetical protein